MKISHRATWLVRPLALTLALAGIPAMTLSAVSTATATTATTATAPTCATTTTGWGSGTRSLSRMTTAPITSARAGRQACFDRMVVDIRGRGAGYTVRYVSQVLSEGQGAVVPLRGGARLAVVVTAPAYNVTTGRSTYRPANPRELANLAGFSTFRQIAWGGTFEGYTTIGVGVRTRLPMRAFIANGPGTGSRVIIDVAHHW